MDGSLLRAVRSPTMIEDGVSERDLARLVVPVVGGLVATGNRYEPYRLLDADGTTVESVTVYFQDLLAAGRAESTVRSYGTDLLRWWRFLHAVDVGWNGASRREARDFSCWVQLTSKRRRAAPVSGGVGRRGRRIR